MLVAVTLAGCGGTISRHAYIQRADAICGVALRSVRSVPPPQLTGSARMRAVSLGTYLARVVPFLRRELKALGALPRPSQRPASARVLHRYLVALRQSVTQFDNLAAAATFGKTALVSSAELALAGNAVPKLAAQYGLADCSSSAPTYG